MIHNSVSLSQTAMRAGTLMGLLWIGKFSVLLVAFYAHNVHLQGIGSALFLLLTAAVPVVAGVMACRYRNSLEPPAMTYGAAWRLVVLIYIYAALLTAVGHYVYWAFLDEGRFIPLYLSYAQQAGMAEEPMLRDLLEQLKEVLPTLTPIQMVIQMFSSNVFYGVLQAIIIALFVQKRSRTSII